METIEKMTMKSKSLKGNVQPTYWWQYCKQRLQYCRDIRMRKLIKYGKRGGAFFLCLAIGGSLMQGISVSAYEQQSGQTGRAKVSHVVASRGGMPVMGEVKPLVVKVAFPDYPFEAERADESVYTDEKLLRLFNGTSDASQTQKADSLGGYYHISSYGQLDIQCEEIYEYTAQYERGFYSGDDNGQHGVQYGGQQFVEQYRESNEGRAGIGDSEQITLDVVSEDWQNRTDIEDKDEVGAIREDEEENVILEDGVVYGRQYGNSINDLDEVYRPEYRLLDEVLEALDDEIDYRNYDSDGDGYIDAVYLNFAGPSGEWGGTWWPHVDVRMNSGQFDGVQYRAYSFIHNHGDEIYEEKQDLLVLIHETGHLLGIPDYYSYTGESSNMLGSFDIMTSVEKGDHNGFTKWTYGWLNEEDIVYIDRESKETTVHLTNLDADDKNGKMIAVIAPENARENGIYSQYFLVEYDAGTNLNWEVFDEYDLTPGFRIFAVNAVLEEENGTNYQKNDNYSAGDRLIYDVRQTSFYGVDDTLFREGDRFAPDTKPASKFYFNYSKVGTSTGIVITDFVTGENPSFQVSFTEVGDDEYTVDFTADTEGVSNMLNMKLYSSMPLDIVDYAKLSEAYLLDEEGTRYKVNISEDMQEECVYWFMYYPSESVLEPNTSYTLVIPQDTFRVTENQNLNEVRIPITTGDFENVEFLNKTPLSDWNEFKSNWVRIEDNTIASLVGNVSYDDMSFDIKLRKTDIDGNGEEIAGLKLPVVTDSEEFLEGFFYTEAKLFSFEDGTMAVELSYLNRLIYYHLDGDGNLIGEPQVAPVSYYDNVFTTGHYIKGVVYDRWTDSTKIFSINFENPPVIIDCDYFVNGICGMENGEYATIGWRGDSFALFLYNGEDELIKDIPIEDAFYALTYADGVFYYLDTNIYVGKMDREGNILKKTNIQQIAEPLLTIWDSSLFDIRECGGRLMVSGILESGYDKIQYVSFFDEEMNPFGYREFYHGVEDVILLKNGVLDVRNEYDIEVGGEYIWLYRLYYTDNHQDDERKTDGADSADDTGKTGDTDSADDTGKTDATDSADDVEKTDNANTADDSEKVDEARKTGADAAAQRAPKTGDEWPAVMLLMMVVSAMAVIAGYFTKNES